VNVWLAGLGVAEVEARVLTLVREVVVILLMMDERSEAVVAVLASDARELGGLGERTAGGGGAGRRTAYVVGICAMPGEAAPAWAGVPAPERGGSFGGSGLRSVCHESASFRFAREAVGLLVEVVERWSYESMLTLSSSRGGMTNSTAVSGVRGSPSDERETEWKEEMDEACA
jgi:hypothetical protein